MTTHSEQAPAGLAARFEAQIERRLAALEQAQVQPDPAAIERDGKALLVLVRVAHAAQQYAQAQEAAAQKDREAKARRDARMDEAIMDEFTPEELEQRAAELGARIDQLLAKREYKSADRGRGVARLGQPSGPCDLRLGAGGGELGTK